MSEAIHPTLSTAENFRLISTRMELQNAQPVNVTRAEPNYLPGYGGEHLTTVIGDDGVLYGYTHQYTGSSAGNLPSHKQAERIAFDFLNSIDSPFAQELTLKWIDQHDETIIDAHGLAATVPGMKVKTRHESGLYTWVIVGSDNQIITYERDIEWNSDHSRRQTAMWLHDAWIIARDSGAAELGGMNAPLDS